MDDSLIIMNTVASVVSGSLALIEPAAWRDLNALRHLERLCFPLDAWPLWDLIGVLTFPDVVRLKAMDEGRMIGFIAGDVRPSQRLAWIATLGVLPEYRRRGVASELLQACEERLDVSCIRLNVRDSNRAAIRLYQRFHYQSVEVLLHYYPDGENALVLEKQFV